MFLNWEAERLSKIYTLQELHNIAKSCYLGWINMTRVLWDIHIVSKWMIHFPSIKQIKPIFDRYLMVSDWISNTFNEKVVLEIINDWKNFFEWVGNIIEKYRLEIMHIYSTAEEWDLDSYYYDNAIALWVKKT